MKLLFILLNGKHSSKIVVAFTQHAMLYALEVDLLHISWEGASHTQITYKLYFMTLGQRSRSPWRLRSPQLIYQKIIFVLHTQVLAHFEGLVI